METVAFKVDFEERTISIVNKDRCTCREHSQWTDLYEQNHVPERKVCAEAVSNSFWV